jgi:hypothetical protein
VPKRPDGVAARLRRCPNGIFWRRKKAKDGSRTPDYNAALLWYLRQFTEVKALAGLCNAECPKLPTFQRSVAHEAVRRREGGKVARR